MKTQLTNKSSQRKFYLQQRRGLSPLQRQEYSEIICHKIMADDYYQTAQVIFLFASMDDEVHTESLIKEALATGKEIALPYILNREQGQMVATKISSFEDLSPQDYGILSVNPQQLNILSPEVIDLVVVPGVAYDKNGYRLGMGAGYYDRYLAQIPKVNTLAAIYHCQLAEEILHFDHDSRVQRIITEQDIISCIP